MPRSLGIHLEPDGYAFALVEGSAKRHQVKACGSGGLDPDTGDPVRALGKAISRALKQAGIGKADQVVLSIPSVDTVLRELSLPFDDRDKVHQVLKFEVESDLYHLDIDDVVCDYVELENDRATNTLLVAAVPKSQIQTALDVASEAGYEPQQIDLDLGSLDVASGAQQRAAPEDEEEASDLEAYLHVGPYSSLLMVRSADGLRSVRNIHVGWRELGRGFEDVEVALEEGAALLVEEGDDQTGADEAEASAPALFGADPELPLRLDFHTVLARVAPEVQQAFLRRLVGEVRRGLAALAASSLGRIHLLGAEIPGLAENLTRRLGVPSAPAAVGPADPDGVQPDPVAYGTALRGLALPGSRMNFRQEEFRFARGLERVEGPLTFALVGLIAFFLVDAVVLFQKTRTRARDIDAMVARASERVDTRLNQALPEGAPRKWFVQTDFDGLDISDLGRLPLLRSRVAGAKRNLDEMVGEVGVEMPQSCLEAWRLVNGVLEAELELGYDDRFMVESLDFLSVDATTRQEAHVITKIGVTLFGDPRAVAGKVDRLIAAFNEKSWTLGSAETQGGFPRLDEVPNASSGILQVLVSPSKAREAGL